MNRITYIDYAKSIAIFLVIVYHSHIFSNDLYSSSILSLCVTIFFMVNGYLMLRKERGLRYYMNKNAKILVLIFLWGG